jgi:sugar phosphate isomerase/epimerase
MLGVMRLGIADVCRKEALDGSRITKAGSIREAAGLGAQVVSLYLPGEDASDIVAAAEESAVALEFRTAGYDKRKLAASAKRAHSLGGAFLRTMLRGRYHYKDPAAQEAMLEAAAANVGGLVPLLEELDVTLGIENHAGVTSPELVALIKHVDSPRVGAVLDFGNSIPLFEDPHYTIETLAPYAVGLHVKDVDIVHQGVVFEVLCVPLGEGILEWDRIMPVLRELCPEIPFMLEAPHRPLPDREKSLTAEGEMLERSVQFARALVADRR